jgi:hypothetical protein
MKCASASFPEEITSDIQMRYIKDYQRAISDASRRLPCGICGGLFQEDEMASISLQVDDLKPKGDRVAVQAWFGSYVFTNKSGKTVSGPTFRLLKLWRLQAGASSSSSLHNSPVTKRRRIL